MIPGLPSVAQIIIRGLLAPEEVARLNGALDANLDKRNPFGPATYGPGAALGGSQAAFRQWNGLLSWPKPHCLPFRDLMCNPRLIPYLNTLLGRGWRLNYDDSLNSAPGCEGLRLHGYGSADLQMDNGR